MANGPLTAWTEIPVTDLEASTAFYDHVFGWSSTIRSDMGPNPVAFFNDQSDAAGGHLYPGKPAKGVGATIHLGIPDTIEAAAARVTEKGGTLVGPVVDIPAGRFQYFEDLDGNSVGLFEVVAAA